ncbi:MAG TPA: glycosyltransferase [Vitreimonas sp.]|nr:glycosyltransferase [Vitreimonas sp.]
MKQARVALVYDRVNTPHGGAEKVLLALHDIFPEAPLYTSVYHRDQARWAQIFQVVPSFLQRLPGADSAHRWLAPLMPLAFESFDLDEYDIVISITSAEAKGVITKPHQLHICYLLTPTRYLYSHHDEYLSSLPNLPGLKWVAARLLAYLRWWDESAAFRPDVYIPISQLVGERCGEFYHTEPDAVLYPPLELDTNVQLQSPLTTLPDNYYLVVSRLVEYKRVDLAIQACQELGRNLVIVGVGPEENKLRALATQNNKAKVTFLGSLSPSELIDITNRATSLLMPGLEDFGITALETVAQGTPAILHAQSGAAELLTDGKEAVFIDEATLSALIDAIKRLETISFNKRQMQKKMQKYATTIFCETFQARVLHHWQRFQDERKV